MDREDLQEPTLLVTHRDAWREWLAANHDRLREIWLVFPKKHTGDAVLPYGEAVEEAICFGWIDSIVKRIDGSRYMRKFTPRSDTENWSRLNVERARRMAAAGRMTAAGLAKIPAGLLRGERHATHRPAPRGFTVPVELTRLLADHPIARRNFAALAPSHRRNYCGWIGSAKKAETRSRRAEEALKLLIRGEKLGLK